MRTIAKDIIVVDRFGNEYTSTYAKRAIGLVKKGRAHWIDGNTICLVCPPDEINLEDHNMNNKAETMNTIDAVCASKETESNKESVTAVLTAMDILSRIDAIIAQGDQLQNVVTQIQNIPVNESPVGGYDGQGRAEAIRSIYFARETTNQKMIEFLNRMYDDIALKPSKKDFIKEYALRALEIAADDENKLAAFSDIIDSIRHIN